MSEYNVTEARKAAFNHLHEALSTPERIEKLADVLYELLDAEGVRAKSFSAGLITNILFKISENGGWLDSGARDITLNGQLEEVSDLVMAIEEVES